MAYKCGNDGREFLTKKELVNHLVDVYDTVFVNGDESLVKLSKLKTISLKETNNGKYQRLKEQFENEGIDLE